MTGKNQDGDMGQVIQIDEGRIKDHLGEIVRDMVEEALNAM
jgi:putative transposase